MYEFSGLWGEEFSLSAFVPNSQPILAMFREYTEAGQLDGEWFLPVVGFAHLVSMNGESNPKVVPMVAMSGDHELTIANTIANYCGMVYGGVDTAGRANIVDNIERRL